MVLLYKDTNIRLKICPDLVNLQIEVTVQTFGKYEDSVFGYGYHGK